jgi:hypothetical protein
MTAEAQRQARAERTWWRAHRDARHLFSQELRAARSVLAHGPKHEVYATSTEFLYGGYCSRRRDATCTTSCWSKRTLCESLPYGAR